MGTNLIISNGISDSELYIAAAQNVNKPFNITTQGGQYPCVGNILANRKLASFWQGMYLDAKVFADGIGITSMNATEDGAIAVRIPLLLPGPRNGRTLALNYGGALKRGTPGNSGTFNNNLPHGMQTDAVNLEFIQVYDEAAQISKTDMDMVGSNLAILAQYTATTPQTVAQITDGCVMGTQIGTALKYYKENPAGRSVRFYDSSATTKGYLQGILNELISSQTNVRNGYKEGVTKYPLEKSCIIMRNSLWDKFMTIDNGAIVNSDISSKMMINGNFSEDGKKLLGDCIMGQYHGVYIKVVPDEYWLLAAAFCGVDKSNLQYWNKVSAYICNAAGTYHGMASVTTEIDKAPTTSIGFIARNDWRWGTAVARKSSITILYDGAEGSFTNPITGTIFENEGTVVQPRDTEAVIADYYDEEDISSSFQAIAVSNNVTECTLTLKDSSTNAVKNAALTVISNGAIVSTSNNGDGTYSFNLGRGTTAKVVIEAEGFDVAIESIATTDTDEATFAKTVNLTSAS